MAEAGMAEAAMVAAGSTVEASMVEAFMGAARRFTAAASEPRMFFTAAAFATAGSGTATFTGTSMGRITMITRITTTRTGAAGSSGPTMARAASATIGTGALAGRLIGERAEMKSGAR